MLTEMPHSIGVISLMGTCPLIGAAAAVRALTQAQ
jgi:hypothetical protein